MIQELANSYGGASYEALVERWGRASKEHMTVLIDCCGVLATGLEIAGDGVVAVATLGLAEAADVAIVEAGKRIVNAILDQIEQEIIGQLVSMAIEPFQAAIENAVSGLVFEGVEAALGGAA